MDVEVPGTEEAVRAAERTGCGPVIPPATEAMRPLRQQIFERVRAAGLIPRVQISRELGISPASVTTATSELIEARLLEEVALPREDGEPARGRPPVALGVRADAHLVVGVKLSDREHTALLVDFAGNQLASAAQTVDTSRMPPERQLDEMERLVTGLLASEGLSLADISAVGLGIPGFVDHLSGHVFWSPVLTERDVEFADMASDRLGLPVVIDNDANLVALAELWFGVGRSLEDFAVVTIEHGVGSGLVLNHRLFRGSHRLGMELGHTKVHLDGALCRCGQRGCLEAYVADYALAREATAALGTIDREMPMQHLLESLYNHAKAGNEAARSIFRRAGRYLAIGIANVANLFDPDMIILSGARMRFDYLYADNTLSELRTLIPSTGRPMPPIEIHAWGDLLWAHGAAALALSVVTEASLGLPREAAA